MQVTPHVETLKADLEAVAAVGDDAVSQAAARLAGALTASLGLRLLEVLQEAAHEVSSQLPSGRVDVRLAGQEAILVYVEDEPAGEAPPPQEEGASARITLRLGESLKVAVEAAATREGLSVNSWLVRALARAVAGGPATRVGSRLTGFAQG